MAIPDNAKVTPQGIEFKPPIEVCEAKATWYKIRGDIIVKTEEIKEKRKEIAKKIFLALTLKPMLGILGDIAGFVSNLATSMVQAVAGEVASVLGGAVEAILSNILHIFLELKSVVYMLVEIPRQSALNMAEMESEQIEEISNNVNLLLAIMNKWVGRFTPTDYDSNLSAAYLSLESAYKDLQTVIEGLDTDFRKQQFRKGAYISAMDAIDQAIEALKLETNTEKLLNREEEIDRLTDEYYAEYSAATEERYKKLNKEASAKYKAEMYKVGDEVADNTNNFITGGGGGFKKVTGVVASEEAYASYVRDTEGYKVSKKYDLAQDKKNAVADAWRDAMSGFGQTITDKYESLAEEFRNDVSDMEAYARKTITAISLGFKYNKLKQIYCNSIVSFESWVNDAIYYISIAEGTIGYGIGKTVSGPIKASRSIVATAMTVAEDGMAAKTEMAKAAAAAGTSVLTITAKTLLNSAVTDSLTAIVNGEYATTAEYKTFKTLEAAIKEIPEWDFKTEGWAMNAFGQGSVRSPYVELVTLGSDVAKHIQGAITPIPDEINDDNQLAAVITNRMRGRVAELRDHNDKVVGALNKWSNKSAPQVDELMRLLKAMNLLEMLAIGMSLGAFIKAMVASFSNGGKVSILTCEKAYPELFSDPDVKVGLLRNSVKSVTKAEANFDSLVEQLNSFDTTEAKYAMALDELKTKFIHNVDVGGYNTTYNMVGGDSGPNYVVVDTERMQNRNAALKAANPGPDLW